MTVLSTTCGGCTAPVELDPSCLLVAIVSDDEVPGRLAYICPACGDLTFHRVPLGTVTTLLAAGCTAMTVTLRQPHPEDPPAGPALTLDDLIDLHAELALDGWTATLTGEQR